MTRSRESRRKLKPVDGKTSSGQSLVEITWLHRRDGGRRNCRYLNHVPLSSVRGHYVTDLGPLVSSSVERRPGSVEETGRPSELLEFPFHGSG